MATHEKLSKEEILTRLHQKETDKIVFDIDVVDGGIKKSFKTEDLVNNIRVETNFKFFEIENVLKLICFETFEPIRTRISQESELGKKRQIQIQKAASDIVDLQ
jgi:hypothetical protein